MPDPLSDLPSTTRIDLTLAVLGSMEMQESGGWSIADLADLCGCSEAAIVARQQAAMARARAVAEACGHADEILSILRQS
jgi:DNA-directed RNA polymerase specialized sigma24 family protein